jgi:hypothetical protein
MSIKKLQQATVTVKELALYKQKESSLRIFFKIMKEPVRYSVILMLFFGI